MGVWNQLVCSSKSSIVHHLSKSQKHLFSAPLPPPPHLADADVVGAAAMQFQFMVRAGPSAAPRPPRALPPPFLLPSIVNMLLSLRPVSIVLNEQIFSYSVLRDFRQNRTNFWSEIIKESCGIDFKNGPFPASFSLFSFFLYS